MKKKYTAFALLIGLMIIPILKAQQKMNSKTLNGMTVNWQHCSDSIQIEMSAPTGGWLCIGFNEKDEITHANLFMGCVRDNKVELVEHYVISPGNYKPIRDLGILDRVRIIEGAEKDGVTTIRFTIHLNTNNSHQKDLSIGTALSLIMAYSMEDDFQHHSIMRTSTQIQL